MECDTFTFDFLREAFPTIDIRVIKATVLEHGVDIESALTFLSSVSDELEDVKNVLPEDKLPARCNSRDTTHYGNAHLVENGETANAISRPPSDYHVDDELEATYADAATVRELSNSESHVSVEFLKEVLEDARRDKEIVSNLVKEISDLRAKADLERTAAERAKREAAVSGKEVLRKAEELREQISEKKQDNLMRMGEIHGEKAVLSTEARGLKLQFEQLKLQKSRVETVLVEIRERLEDCYQEAVKERLMAEEEGRMKLKLAQEILAEEEIAMAAVEEESKRLEIEADSCMQLKEFLSQQGSVIDSLKGEMYILADAAESFKCQVNDGMWSSLSTASLPAHVNPEAPYIFRKGIISSSMSSEDSGQASDSFESEKQLASRASILSSTHQSVERLSGQSDASSLACDKEFQQQKVEGNNGCHQSLTTAPSLCGSAEIVTNTMSDVHRLKDSHPLLVDSKDFAADGSRPWDLHWKHVSKEIPGNSSELSIDGYFVDAIASSDPQLVHDSRSLKGLSVEGSYKYLNGSWFSQADSASVYQATNSFDDTQNYDMPDSPAGNGGWIFTAKEVPSSTSSSLVEVGPGGFCSD